MEQFNKAFLTVLFKHFQVVKHWYEPCCVQVVPHSDENRHEKTQELFKY